MITLTESKTIELSQKVQEIRNTIKQLTTEKDELERELEDQIKSSSTDASVIIGDSIVKLTPTITYDLNEEGIKLIKTIDFSEKVWNTTYNMSEIKKDSRFTKDMLIEKIGKTKISFKDVDTESKETLKG